MSMIERRALLLHSLHSVDFLSQAFKFLAFFASQGIDALTIHSQKAFVCSVKGCVVDSVYLTDSSPVCCHSQLRGARFFHQVLSVFEERKPSATHKSVNLPALTLARRRSEDEIREDVGGTPNYFGDS